MNRSLRVSLLIFFLFLAFGTIILWVQPKGWAVLYLNDRHGLILDQVFRYITFLGDGIWFVPLIIFTLFKRYFWSASFALLGVLQMVLIQGLKRGVFGKLPRPAEYFKGSVIINEVKGVDLHHFFSFPSGHTASAFGIAFLIIFLIRPKASKSIILVTLACLVGISRIYLAQHFLIDVVAGAGLGLFTAYVVWIIFQRLMKKFHDAPFFTTHLKFPYSKGE